MKVKLENTTKKAQKIAHHIYPKSSCRTPRHIPKPEQRYRILENTMRGYFDYSLR